MMNVLQGPTLLTITNDEILISVSKQNIVLLLRFFYYFFRLRKHATKSNTVSKHYNGRTNAGCCRVLSFHAVFFLSIVSQSIASILNWLCACNYFNDQLGRHTRMSLHSNQIFFFHFFFVFVSILKSTFSINTFVHV